MGEDVRTTRHSAERTKNRVGLSKKLTDKNAQRAFDYGLTHAETKAGLCRYLDKLYLPNGTANNMRVYHRYQIQEMLWSKKSINWNDYPADCKRGACCVKVLKETEMKDPQDSSKTITVQRRVWEVDRDIPIFTQDRSYIEKLL